MTVLKSQCDMSPNKKHVDVPLSRRPSSAPPSRGIETMPELPKLPIRHAEDTFLSVALGTMITIDKSVRRVSVKANLVIDIILSVAVINFVLCFMTQ